MGLNSLRFCGKPMETRIKSKHRGQNKTRCVINCARQKRLPGAARVKRFMEEWQRASYKSMYVKKHGFTYGQRLADAAQAAVPVNEGSHGSQAQDSLIATIPHGSSC